MKKQEIRMTLTLLDCASIWTLVTLTETETTREEMAEGQRGMKK